MPLTVKSNTSANHALNELNKTTRSLSRNFERISSGLRISRAADDAAGLGVAENLRASSQSAMVAMRNINDGVSIIAVAEGAAGEVSDILIRMRELAVQSASETLDDDQRSYIQTEYVQLASEVDRISNVTEFNGNQLANGTLNSLNVQAGVNNTANDVVTITLGDLTSATLGVDTGTVSMASSASASAALDAIDSAIAAVSSYRADFGAVENRLGSALNNLEVYSENTQAAESRIRDADFGYETAQLSQNQILQQAGTAILQQTKNINQAVTQLLQS
jgi:flagellin